MKTTTYSEETQTIIGLFEQLPPPRRKFLLEKILDLMLEVESENKWDSLLKSHPGPMLKMAKRALHEHKSGLGRNSR